MTIIQTANALGLKVRTLRKWISIGKIKAEKRGKCWYIPESEIYREEIIDSAIKGREHSRRIKEGKSVGVREQNGQNPEESI